MPTKNPYSLKAKVVQRSKGQSALASAAYQAGEKLRDERTGRWCNYSKKKGIVHAEIFAPAHSPGWARNRGALWNRAEAAEKRKDAQIARKFILALPRQLSHEQRVKCAQGYIQEQFVAKGMIADLSIHLPEVGKNQDNHHLHLLTTMRVIGPEGFGEKNRAWNKTSLLDAWREQWAVHVNRALESAGFEPTWDHRTLEEQGIDRIPQVHLGQAVLEMESRGIQTQKGQRALEIAEGNRHIEELQKNEIRHEQQRPRTDSKIAQPAAADRKTRAAAPASPPANFLPAEAGGSHGQSAQASPPAPPPTGKKLSRSTPQPAMSQPPSQGDHDMNLSPAEQQEFLRVRRQIAAHQQAEAEARQRQLSEEQKQRFLELEALAEEAEHTREDHRYLDHDFAWGCMYELRRQRQTVETVDWKETESNVAAKLLSNGSSVADVAGLVFDLGLTATIGNPLPSSALQHLQNLAINSTDLADAMRSAERREKEERQQRAADENGDHDHKQSFPKPGI